MPMVNGKKFPYTKAGVMAAKRAATKKPKPRIKPLPTRPGVKPRINPMPVRPGVKPRYRPL